MYSANTLCVGLARLGQHDQRIVAGTIKELLSADFGQPLHALIVVGDLHIVEKEVGIININIFLKVNLFFQQTKNNLIDVAAFYVAIGLTMHAY